MVELWDITGPTQCQLSANSLLIALLIFGQDVSYCDKVFSEPSRVCGLPQSVCNGVTTTCLHPVCGWQLWVSEKCLCVQ